MKQGQVLKPGNHLIRRNAAAAAAAAAATAAAASRLRKREDKLDILMSDSLRRELGTESSYAYLRLLLPDCDSARKVYNVKETAMGKLLIKALRIPEGNIKAQRLIHYKNGTINPEGTGDLPATLESILKDGAFAAAHTDQAPLTIGK
eukprot:6844-Heterococcus_DN1.PRE.1